MTDAAKIAVAFIAFALLLVLTAYRGHRPPGVRDAERFHQRRLHHLTREFRAKQAAARHQITTAVRRTVTGART